MDNAEKAAFWEKMCENGIRIQPYEDMFAVLFPDKTYIKFNSKDECIEYLKMEFDWKWTEKTEVIPESKGEIISFDVVCMFDIGFGYQHPTIGIIEINSNDLLNQEGYDKLEAEQERLTKLYFSKDHPTKEYDKIKKETKIIPRR